MKNIRQTRSAALRSGMILTALLLDWKIQVRGEAFNAFNHPCFGGPNTDPGSANFGVVDPSQQNQPRVLQLAIKINF
jgi:hypothetical protein